MFSASLKRLGATTALVSAAVVLPQAGFAQTVINSPEVTTQATSGVTDGYTVNAGGSIIVSGAAAVDFDGDNTENFLTISSGTTVSSDFAGGTILTGADGFEINNSGTLSNTGGGYVVDYNGNANLFISNAGTILGSIRLSGLSGNVNLGSGSTMTGDIEFGAGDQALTMYLTTLEGNVDFGDADTQDSLFLTEATIDGDVTAGDGDDAFTIAGPGGITGRLDTGTGNDTVGFSVSGGGSQVFTLGDGIAGDADITTAFTSNVILNGTASTGGALSILGSSRFTANTSFVGSDALTLDATLALGADAIVTMDSLAGGAAGADSALIFNVDGNSAGQLVIGNGAADFSTTDFSITVGSGVYIANGTEITLVDTNNLVNSGTLLTTESGIYNFELNVTDLGDDLILSVTRDALNTVITGGAGTVLAGVLDDLGADGSDELDTIQSEIGSLGGIVANDAAESLLPAVDGAVYTTIVDTQQTVLNNVSDRLADLRTGMAAGDKSADRNMWVKGFGQTAEHDGNNGNRGFDSDTVGATFGVDKNVKDGHFGLAFTYADSNVDSKSANNASTEVSNYQVSAYGTRNMTNGLFMNWMAGVGYNDIETNRTIDVGGFDRAVKGDTKGIQLAGKVEFGKDFKQGSAVVTPLAGVQYGFIKNKDYTETGAGGASLVVEQDNMHLFNVSTGARAAWKHKTADGTVVLPHITGMLQYNLGDDKADVTSQFTGGGATFETSGVEMDRFGVNLGTGVTWQMVNGVDLSVNYDADLRQDYTSHNAFVKARWSF